MRRMIVGLVCSFVATSILAPSAVNAAAWESKTMQSPFSAREVGRTLKLPKGWMEMSLGADVKLASAYWDADGNAVDFENASWLYSTESVSFRYGLSHNSEIYLRVPMHYMRLTHDAYGTDTSGTHLGDPTIGAVFSLLESDAPRTSVVARVQLKSPAGNESPGSYISGPSTFQDFVTTTGSHDLTVEMAAKRQIGGIAVVGRAGYVNRFSGLVQWLIETEQNQLLGRFKPGNRMYGGLELIAQVGPLAVKGGARMMVQGDAKAGTTSGGISPDGQLLVQANSGGSYLDADVGVVAHFSRNVDVELGASIPLKGEDLMFFPLEDLHPTVGNTYTAILKLRY
jgi:hypothetical protein